MTNTPFWDEKAKLSGLRAVIDYNDTAGHKNAYIDCVTKTALELHQRFSATERVLDFGCGVGRISTWLAPRVRSVAGIDPSAKMVERAREAAQQASLRNAEFSVFDGRRIEPAEGFDAVTCVYVLECLSDDTAFETALSEMVRVTRSGGRLLFIERTSDTHPDEPWEPGAQVRRRPLTEYRSRLAGLGLEIAASQSVRDPRPIAGSWILNRLVMRGAVPRRLLPAVARADLWSRRRGGAPLEWSDTLLVCRKP